MLVIVGKTQGEYFNVECERCEQAVRFYDLRMVGGVPQIKVECPSCHEEDDLKLHPVTWGRVVPGIGVA